MGAQALRPPMSVSDPLRTLGNCSIQPVTTVSQRGWNADRLHQRAISFGDSIELTLIGIPARGKDAGASWPQQLTLLLGHNFRGATP